MSFMAPQAYTKETLVKAFDWLQHQPSGLKQVATSPDVLVGLFLKAQRQGINNIDADAPVSSKKFIDDLKSLKKDFAQFEDPNAAPTPTMHQMVQQQAHYQNPAPTAPPQSAAASPVHDFSRPSSQNQSVNLPFELDEKTLQSLQYIQERFNLSSPQEALRMAISVGIQRISQWE